MQVFLLQNEVPRLAGPVGQTHLPQSRTGLTVNTFAYLCGAGNFPETPDAKWNTPAKTAGTTWAQIPGRTGTAPRFHPGKS